MFCVQLSGWWFLTFTASEIKERVQYITGVQYLYDTINPDQLEIPQFVLDHDKSVKIKIHKKKSSPFFFFGFFFFFFFFLYSQSFRKNMLTLQTKFLVIGSFIELHYVRC